MGFLSGITNTLFGGSQSGGSSQATSGWGLLPTQVQNAYTNYADAVNKQIPNATSAYTPLPETAGETQAYSAINKGFAPDQATLNSDIAMFMNPFNDSVISQLNKQAGGQYSVLKQGLNEAGQFGSNRQVLGANDIENTRQSNIGSLLQNQYNTAIGHVFNNLIPQQQQDALNQIGVGGAQRTLAGQTAQAPITGLQQIGSALGILPTSGGSTSNSENSASQQKGIFGGLTG